MGTVSLNAIGNFAYTPGAGFWGVDSFIYKSNNGTLDGNTATVTVMTHNALQVKKLYNQVLHRDPELSGWEYWTRRVNSGTASLGTLASGIFESPEHIDPIVTQMYHDYLFRSPDPDGLAYWRGIWQHDGEPENVIAGIVGSPEFFQSAGGTNQGWVTEMYHRLLDREPDPQGLSFWTAKLGTGTLDRFHVILGFVESDENFHNLVRRLVSAISWSYALSRRRQFVLPTTQDGDNPTSGPDRTARHHGVFPDASGSAAWRSNTNRLTPGVPRPCWRIDLEPVARRRCDESSKRCATNNPKAFVKGQPRHLGRQDNLNQRRFVMAYGFFQGGSKLSIILNSPGANPEGSGKRAKNRGFAGRRRCDGRQSGDLGSI